MANMATAFSGFSSIWTILKYGVIFFIFLLIAGGVTGVVLWFAYKKKQTNIIEIDGNRRIRTYSGGYKKRKGTDIEHFYSRKFKRNLPKFQQKDVYSKGTNDALMLYKDNNGMYHSLRVPKWEEIVEWYKVHHLIDLDKGIYIDGKHKGKKVDVEEIRDIYLLPSPHEDIDWLANQCVESEREFKDLEWWQHPNVMVIGSAAIAAFIQMVNLVFIYLMHK